MAIKVCVLLASYNGENWIAEQLHSVLKQTDVLVDVFISDDGSNDGTKEIVRKFDNNRVLLLADKPKSGAASQNFFRLILDVDFSSYDFISFCDQDDIWYSDKLIRAVTILKSTNSAGYSAPVVATWPDGRKKILSQSEKTTQADYLFEGAGQGCTFVLSRQFALTVQALVKKHRDMLCGVHYHDWVVYAIARALGYVWFFDKYPVMMYRQHDNNDTGARGSLAGVLKRFNLIKDGWYKNQLEMIQSFLLKISNDNSTLNYVFDISRRAKFSSVGRYRFVYMIFLLRNSRRRAIDRLVLSFSALLGWVP